MANSTPAKRNDVRVVIVTRNTWAFTRAAVKSVLESKGELATEVVVVDNGSTDETPNAFPREFPAVNYIRFEKNLGFGAANNLGARDMGSEFLLLLNSDARLNPDSLATAIAWMRSHESCGIAGAQLLNPDGSLQNSIANLPTLATELLNKPLLRRLFPERFPGKERIVTEPMEVESVVGAFMLVRATAWEAVGGFDERYFFFLEETDLCLQARRRGWKIFHLPQVRVWHEQGGSARSLAAAARIEYWRSRYLYFAKNHGRFTRGALGLGLWMRLLANGVTSGLLTLLTFGQSAHWRNAWKAARSLAVWHLQGRPPEAGLPR